MKIALFAPYDLAAHGGIASHVRAQARALRALGHAVSVFGPASAALPSDEVALAGSTTVVLGGTASGAALDPRVFTTVRRLFARQRFDVVHVHEPLMPLLPWAAVWCARAPVVATFHVYREHGHRWYPIARPLLERIIARVDARIAVSEAARGTVAAEFPGDYRIIPNGIELARFQAAAPRPAALPPGPIVLYVGRLERRKAVGTLIEAMVRVQDRVGDVTLVIVGDGPEHDRLRAHARRANVRALFLTAVEDEALPAFYGACDLFCAPAIGGESFGIVLIEALAAGRPVVASRIDGYFAAVGESPCVHWVPPGEVTTLAAAVTSRLLARNDCAGTDALRLAARYDWNEIAAQHEALYRELQRSASDATGAAAAQT